MLLKVSRVDRPTLKMQTYRQGDVLLKKMERLPEDAYVVEFEERVILQLGEVTGHAHAISKLDATMYTARGDRFLEINPGGADLVHEEHGTIHLPAGFYQVVQQREYVPEAPPRDVID
jgi:hypothetical protein